MGKTRTFIIGSAIAVVVIGSIANNRYKRSVELNKQQSAKEFAEVPVTLAEVELMAFRTAVPFTGNLLAVNRAELKAEVSGRVTRVSVFEGDYIKAGQVLSVQDEEDLVLAVNAAEAQLVQAQAQAQQATADFERATQLLEKRSITKQAAQQAETYYTASQAGVRAAESNLGIAKSRLHKAQIQSPFDGQVAQCFVKAGEILNPGQSAFSIVDNRKMEIEADLPSDNISIVRPGLTVRFTVPGMDAQFEGQVAQVSPAVKQDGRTLRVRIEVPNDGGRLKSGLFADGEIISSQTTEKPAIPSSIVTAAGRGTDVFVAESIGNDAAVKVARQKRVSIGTDQNGWRPVENAGLAPGQFIVAQGRELVSDGARLRVVAPPENASQKKP